MESFRETGGGDWASYRRELRERMLELRRLRDSNREEAGRGAWQEGGARPASPFSHSAESGFVPVGEAVSRPRALDIVGPPERSGGHGQGEGSDQDPGAAAGRRIPVWTGAGPQSRRTFMEEFLAGEEAGREAGRGEIQRVLRDSVRVLAESERVLAGSPGPSQQQQEYRESPITEVQRVTLQVSTEYRHFRNSHKLKR